MKKKVLMLICLVACVLCVFSACKSEKPNTTKPTTAPTEPAMQGYVLAKTKADIPVDSQMTPENIDAWLEQYTTTDENEAKNAVRWSQISSIEYKWTKDNIAKGTILSATMFTNTVPEGVIPPDPTENLTYDKNYIGVIDRSGLSLSMSAADLMSKLPEGTTGKSIQVQYIDVNVIDRDKTNPDANYTERLNGVYNLKQQSGDIVFTMTSSDISLGGFESLLGNIELLTPAMMYYTYYQQHFNDPVVQISCTVNVDNKPYSIMLGGQFAMTIDPLSGLDHQTLVYIAEQAMNGGNSMGGNLAELLEGLLGIGSTGIGTQNGGY